MNHNKPPLYDQDNDIADKSLPERAWAKMKPWQRVLAVALPAGMVVASLVALDLGPEDPNPNRDYPHVTTGQQLDQPAQPEAPQAPGE